MNYIKIGINFSKPGLTEAGDIIVAHLSELDFESFSETESGLEAFVPENKFIKSEVENLLSELDQLLHFTWLTEVVVEKNWNEEWEKNYEPVLIAARCHIRAPFHKKMEKVDFEIEIEPKMSFGTAHHETTQMMIELMLEKDFQNLNVLDMGCGTGVLAILASKMGAKEVLAIDNDEWAYKNAIENVQKNNITNITVMEGDDKLIENKQFDIIIANINRNILLQQFPAYVNSLQSGGLIFLSGFYEADVAPLLEKAKSGNLNLIQKIKTNSWVAMIVG